jgi:hypothetical protein
MCCQAAKAMYPRACALNGGDPTIGRKLFRYFGEAGIGEPELRLVQSFGSAGDSDPRTFQVWANRR